MLKEILLAFSKKNTFEVYQLFKHVYEGNEILSTNEELSPMKKLTEKGVMLDIIPSLKFFDEMFNIEKVVEAKNTVMKGKGLISDEREEQTLCMPCLLKIYKTELHYVKHIYKCNKVNILTVVFFNR